MRRLKSFKRAIVAWLMLATIGFVLFAVKPVARVLTIEPPKPMPVQPIEFKPDIPKFTLPPPVKNALSDLCVPHLKQLERMSVEVFGINAPVARFAAQLDQESRCKSQAVSSAGARGIAQFMPGTARMMAKRYPELAPADPTNNDWAIRAQLYLMRDLVDYYEGARTPCDQWQFAISAYNGGQKALGAEQLKAPDPQAWANSVQPQRARTLSNWQENRDYVKQIMDVREPALVKQGIDSDGVCHA